MNTPEPCSKCVRCKWNVLTEENPLDEAWCDLGLQMGNMKCKEFYKEAENG